MYWKQWLRTLISIVVLLGVLESLLPSGETAKFAKLVFGLSIMLVVLQPLTLLVNPDLLGVDLAWFTPAEPAPELTVHAAKIRYAGARPFVGQVEEALADLDGMERVKVELRQGAHGEPQVHVFIHPWDPELSQAAAQLAAVLLSVQAQNIFVQPWTN